MASGGSLDSCEPPRPKTFLARPVPADRPKSKQEDDTMPNRHRDNIQPGQTVDIVLKKDQRTGRLTRGIVETLLTKSPYHSHGIKVRLTDGQVGRVKHLVQ